MNKFYVVEVAGLLAQGLPASICVSTNQSSLALLRPGGYMRTGTGTGEEVSHESPRFFVTGACGQIGQEFLPYLRSK